MSIGDVETSCDALRAFIVGATSLETTAHSLGLAAGGESKGRLGVYRHAYLHNIEANMNALFPITRRVVTHLGGNAAWASLAHDVARDHPPPEIRFGTASLVPLLALRAEALGLPVWVAELADLEVEERRVFTAEDREESDLPRLADALTLRTYRHDVVSVRCSEAPEQTTPEARLIVVAIWRTRSGRRVTRHLSASAVRALRAFHEGGEDALLALVAREPPTFGARVRELVAAGALCNLSRPL